MVGKKAKALSFLGGLVVFSAVAGVLLVKNKRLREEVQEQTAKIMDTSKKVLDKAQQLINKAEEVTGVNIIAKKSSNKESDKKAVDESKAYADLWSLVESQNEEYVNTHLPR